MRQYTINIIQTYISEQIADVHIVFLIYMHALRLSVFFPLCTVTNNCQLPIQYALICLRLNA